MIFTHLGHSKRSVCVLTTGNTMFSLYNGWHLFRGCRKHDRKLILPALCTHNHSATGIWPVKVCLTCGLTDWEIFIVTYNHCRWCLETFQSCNKCMEKALHWTFLYILHMTRGISTLWHFQKKTHSLIFSKLACFKAWNGTMV